MAQTTGTLTNVNDTVGLAYVLDNAVYFTLSGTFAGMTVQFQISKDGGTNWASLPVGTLLPTGTGTISRGSQFKLADNESRQFFSDDIALGTKVRAKLLAATSGKATVTIQTVPTAGPNTSRNSGVLHRNAVTAADKLATVGTITTSSQTGGSLTQTTNYQVTAAAYNRWGNALPATVVTQGTNTNQTIRAAFAEVAGADGYDIFLSTDAVPKWVGRITEGQRASGIVITAPGVTGAGGTPGAVDIQVAGTGLASNVNPFLVNNAYTPTVNQTLTDQLGNPLTDQLGNPLTDSGYLTLVNCAGYSRAHCHVKLAVTDLRSLPTLSIVPFLQDQLSTTDWFQGQLQAVSLLAAAGQCLEQDFEIDVDGASGLVVLIDTITGQGAACTIWIELAR